MAYDLGDVVVLSTTVMDSAGQPANAGSMALTITLPDDTTVVVGPIASTSTGVYVFNYATVQAGRHLVRWVASGANATVYTDVFDVRDRVPVAIVSLADAKIQLNIAASFVADDEELRGFIAGASLAVERQLGTVVSRRSFTERRTADSGGRVVLSNVPVLAVSSAQSADGATVWSAGDLDVDEGIGLVVASAGPKLSGDVVFVYAAGLRIVPDDYQLA